MTERAATAAIVPYHGPPPTDELLEGIARHVGRVLVVNDAARSGKGRAVAGGLRRILRGDDAPASVLVIDADGQHPPDAIPAFLSAARRADLVIGDRSGDVARMPVQRRFANRLANALLSARTGHRVRDGQCGMRLLTRRALHEVPFGPGGYEAETVHLRRCLLAGVPVEWTPIPAIYDGEQSSFRALRDGIRVLGACLG